MTDWLRCPLHLDKLTEQCPRCETRFERHAYPFDSTPFASCRRCGWQPMPAFRAATARQGERRLQIMADYDAWLQRIHAAGIEGDWRTRLFVGAWPENALAGVHRLIPGPVWIDDCLEEVGRVSVLTHERRGGIRRPAVLTSAQPVIEMLDVSPHCPHRTRLSRRGEIVAQVRSRVAKLIEQLVEEASRDVRRANPSLHLRVDRQARRDYVVVDDTVSSTMLAFWLWREHISELHDNEAWSQSPSMDPAADRLVSLWFRGPGTLLWGTHSDSTRWMNRTTGLWVSALWYEQTLRDLLCMFTRLAEAAHLGPTCDVAAAGTGVDRYRRSLAAQLPTFPRPGCGAIDVGTALPLVLETDESPVFLLESSAGKVTLKVATYSSADDGSRT